MSLLDTASLIVTPNGYKEGKLYSVIPSDGSGDMSVTRATTATRVNSAGLVELVPYNLFNYSQKFDNAYWIKSSSNVTADNTTAPDGTTTADKMTITGGFGAVYASSIPLEGTHTISCFFKKGNASSVYIDTNGSSGNIFGGLNLDTLATSSVGGAIVNVENVGNGWYRLSITASFTGTTSYIAFGILSASSNLFTYLWGAQLVEGSTAKDYQKTETRLNIPRLDYSNGTCPSLLVEPQRTNAVTYSEFFSTANGYNYQNASQSGSSIVSPSGLLAYGITSTTSANDFHRYYKTLGGRTGVNTTTIFAKKGTSRYLGLGVNQNGSTGNNNVVVFDLQDGVIASNTYGVTASIEDFGDGWYRLVHTFDYGTGGTYADICVHNTGTSTYTINAFQTFDSPSSPTTIYVWGLQLEAGSYPTSYIPTTSASVTRNADVISKTGISSLIGQTEGTAFIDLQVDSSFAQANMRFLDISNNTYDNWYFLGLANTNELVLYFRSSATTYVSVIVPFTFGHNKIAFAYANNDYVAYVNGSQVYSTSSLAVGSTSKFTLGNEFDFSSTSKQFINAAALWKERKDNATLAQLTSI